VRSWRDTRGDAKRGRGVAACHSGWGAVAKAAGAAGEAGDTVVATLAESKIDHSSLQVAVFSISTQGVF
jgi:hypothetical protein